MGVENYTDQETKAGKSDEERPVNLKGGTKSKRLKEGGTHTAPPRVVTKQRKTIEKKKKGHIRARKREKSDKQGRGKRLVSPLNRTARGPDTNDKGAVEKKTGRKKTRCFGKAFTKKIAKGPRRRDGPNWVVPRTKETPLNSEI